MRNAGVAREGSVAPGVRGYSPPPPSVSPIRGLIDFHTHAAPDVFGRAVDDDELASQAAARQMEAVVFKNHVALTADRAWLARKHVPGVKVFGGIVLNGAVGGNQRPGRRMDVAHAGRSRSRRVVSDLRRRQPRAPRGHRALGIRVVDERGVVLAGPCARSSRCARPSGIVVHTGHSSAEQALSLIAAARADGCDRVVVTHAQFDVVDMNEAQDEGSGVDGREDGAVRARDAGGPRGAARVDASLQARVGRRHRRAHQERGRPALRPRGPISARPATRHRRTACRCS